jgi:hypothetical protein
MAAKTTPTSNSSLAVGLERVQPALAAWRQRRRHREAIPENLWRMIVPLAQAHGVSPVAQALRLNYTALKQRAVAVGVRPPVGNALGGFVEVPVMASPGAPPWVIEMEDGRGAKLTLRLAPDLRGETTTLLALAQGLWRQRQ